jgi:hypothetical protein
MSCLVDSLVAILALGDDGVVDAVYDQGWDPNARQDRPQGSHCGISLTAQEVGNRPRISDSRA